MCVAIENSCQRENQEEEEDQKVPFSEGQWSSASPCLALAVLLTGESKQNSDKLTGKTSKKQLQEKGKGTQWKGGGKSGGKTTTMKVTP